MNRKNTMIIGDCTSDMICGKSAGILTGAALWGCEYPELLLKENPDAIFTLPINVVNYVHNHV